MPEPTLKIVKLTDIAPDSANANKHTQRGRGLLEKSMRERGFFRPMAAAGKGVAQPVMLAGNLTQETAVDIGLDEAIVIESDGTRPIVHVRTDLEPNSEAARILAVEDNRVGQVSLDWDSDRLSALRAQFPERMKSLFTEPEFRKFGVNGDAEGADAEPPIDRAEELCVK